MAGSGNSTGQDREFPGEKLKTGGSEEEAVVRNGAEEVGRGQIRKDLTGCEQGSH